MKISNEELQYFVNYETPERSSSIPTTGLITVKTLSDIAKELLRLRTLVPLADRLCLDTHGTELYKRSALHLEMEIEKYRKDFE